MNEIDTVARLTSAIGTPAFPRRFLETLGAFSGSELCSAFAFERSGPPRVVFAEGWLATVPAFAQIASADYAREYWRRDAVGQRMRSRGSAGAIEVFRVTAGGISDAEHRRACYDRAGVGERLSLCRAGSPAILASGYRMRAAGPFGIADIERVERFAPLLMSALGRHVELAEGSDGGGDAIQLLMAGEHGLTGREAQVAAGLAQGLGQAEIGAEAGLALSSVITYRRRAYRKLGVADRRQLRRLLEGLRG
ncbi:MAG: helix-turn-helix transcriptional regulator [Novosphingobium sp.]|nr:helix-turn-helix transcriptional regulator [Novosphingobium sp.]